ncbi:MAG: GAF domain-containing protein [Anaerolineales bacterium]|nr:GAF domain-containing protein [Anaerolineales bacterium]
MNLTSLFGAGSTEDTSLQTWRERVLQALLWLLLVIGSIAYITNVIDLIGQQAWSLIVVITVAYVWVLVITVVSRLPYQIRAYSVLIVSYILGPFSLSTFALSGDGRIWLLFFAVFGTVLLGWRVGAISLLIVIGTHALFGYVMVNDFIPISEEALLNSTTATGWVTTGIVMSLVGAILITAISILLQGLDLSLSGLQDSLQTQKDLTDTLEAEQIQLEERTRNLERRLTQIRTAAEISRIIVGELNPEALMQRVVDLIKDRFNLYYVGIFLLDEKKRYANLVSGTGEAGQRMLAAGHRLSVGGSSMIGWATANKKPRIAMDVGREAIHFNNPYLPLTRSELALPLLRGNEVMGALSVQSVEEQAFDEDDIAVLQNISDILANALENAHLFEQIENTLEEISNLNRQYLNQAWADVLQSQEDLEYSDEAPSGSTYAGDLVELQVPLTLRGDQSIGNITIESGREKWSSDEMEFIEAVSTQAALALESVRLLEETQRQVEQEAALNRITTRFAQNLDFDSLLQTVVSELGQLSNVRDASIHIIPPEPSNGDQQPGATTSHAADDDNWRSL